jgi:hypothetical protein
MSLHEDSSTLRYVEATVGRIKKHLLTYHREDDRTKGILAKFRGVQLLRRRSSSPGTYNSGMFSHSSGIMFVAPRDSSGKRRTEKSLNKTIVHELAHATRFKYPGEKSHSTSWKSAWVFLLKVCTEELGMVVDVPCSSVTFYGLSKKDCPTCDWETDPTFCPEYKGPPRGHG